VALVEDAGELGERVGGLLDLRIGEPPPGAGEPRELGAVRIEPRRERRDLAERDSTLVGALQLGASRGRLRRVLAVEDERLGQVVAVCDLEQARPQVVVLALAERGVVAQPVRLEGSAIEQHGRMEERRGEERRPAHGARAHRHPVHRPEPPPRVQVDHPRSDDGDRRAPPDPVDETLEPAGQRDIVGVHPRDVRAARDVETGVEGARETERGLVPDDVRTLVAQ